LLIVRDVDVRVIEWGRLRSKSGDKSPHSKSFEKSLIDSRVSVDAAVAEERPVAPHFLDSSGIYFGDQNLFAIHRALGDHDSKRIAYKRRTPKFDTRSVVRLF